MESGVTCNGFVCLVFFSDLVLEAAALQVLIEAFVAVDRVVCFHVIVI